MPSQAKVSVLQIDAFAGEPFTGNPAAVCLPDTEPPADLDPERVVAMLRTRAEGGSAQPTARRPRWWRRG